MGTGFFKESGVEEAWKETAAQNLACNEIPS